MPGRVHVLFSAVVIPLVVLGTTLAAAAPSKATAVAPKAGVSRPAAPGAAHRRGKPPLHPSPTLPAHAQTQPEDLGARRGVAGGTPETYLERATDPELRALRSAERVLFPELLNGFSPGWSWGRLDPSVQAGGIPPAVEALPSARVQVARDAEWLASLAMPDFPVRLDEKVVEYLRFYRDSEKGQAILQVWARKVGRYTAPMVAELAKAGLPRDLVWVSLIESGHNPTIYSAAGAAGLWQFIPDSARMYGLTVDRWVDERLDPMRSTQAAGKYLSDLYQRFGSWELAMAAYNMGHGGLARSVVKYNTNDFWKLSNLEAALPWETALYVPKVFALAIVMNNRRAFGIGDVPLDPAVSFDTVYVRSGLPLEAVAKAAGIPLESLRTMNPQYLTGRTPPSATLETDAKWPLRVPHGTGRKATTALLDGATRAKTTPYVVRIGDSIETVVHRCRTSVEQLTLLNTLGEGENLKPGAVLLCPTLPAGQALAADVEDVVAIPAKDFQVPSRKRVFYRVTAGDSLDTLSTALGVSAAELALWNELDRDANLVAGMTLQAFVMPESDLQRIRVVTGDQTQIMRVGSREFIEYFEETAGRKRIVVNAKEGDTLSSIGKRFGLSPGMMERINHLSRSAPLSVGQEVIVYATKNKGVASPLTLQPRPLTAANAPMPQLLPN